MGTPSLSTASSVGKGQSEKFWLGLQEDFNLEEAQMRLGDRLDREVKTHAA
jgi:plasmid maintenance system antidote protein VapI